jgi:hypothetical protein
MFHLQHADTFKDALSAPFYPFLERWLSRFVTPKRRLRECSPGDSFLVLDNGPSATLAL